MSLFMTLRQYGDREIVVEVTRMIRTETGKIVAVEGVDTDGVSHAITPDNIVFAETRRSA